MSIWPCITNAVFTVITVVTFSGASSVDEGTGAGGSVHKYMLFAEGCTIQSVTSHIHKLDTLWVRIPGVTIRNQQNRLRGNTPLVQSRE